MRRPIKRSVFYTPFGRPMITEVTNFILLYQVYEISVHVTRHWLQTLTQEQKSVIIPIERYNIQEKNGFKMCTIIFERRKNPKRERYATTFTIQKEKEASIGKGTVKTRIILSKRISIL